MKDLDLFIRETVRRLRAEMAYDKVQPFYGPSKGAQKGHGNVGGPRNRGQPGYPVPPERMHARGTDNRDEAGGLEVLEGKKQHTGTCIMLSVPNNEARQLAVEGGEPPESLHITMFYAKGLSRDQQDTVKSVWEEIWPKYRPLELGATDFGVFPASESSDGKDVLYATPTGEGLHELHQELVERLSSVGIESTSEHEWKPHITLKYLEDGSGKPDEIPEVNFEVSEYVFNPGVPAEELGEGLFNKKKKEITIGAAQPPKGIARPDADKQTAESQPLWQFHQAVARRLKIPRIPGGESQLGFGSTATAWDIGDNKILKITSEEEQARAAAHFKRVPGDHIVKIYDVFRFPPPYNRSYGIVAEKLTPLSNDEMLAIDKVSSFFNTVPSGVSWRQVKEDPREYYPYGNFEQLEEIVQAYGLDGLLDEMQMHRFSTDDFTRYNIMKRADGTMVLADLGNSVFPYKVVIPVLAEGGPIDRMTGPTDFSGDRRIDADVQLESAKDWLKAATAATIMGLATPTAQWDAPEPPPPAPQVAPKKMTVDEMCWAAEKKYGLPHNLLRAMAHVESSGNRHAISKAGARGLMQIMPDTAAELGVGDPHDEEQAIEGAGRYMQKLLKKFKGNITRALQAYNGGPYKHPSKFKSETKKYPKKVLFVKAQFDKQDKQTGVKEAVDAIIREVGMGGLGTGKGYEGGGRGGSGSWSGYNPRGNFLDHEEEEDEDIAKLNPSVDPAPGADAQYQQLSKSPATRMLPMGHRGVPNGDLPSINKVDGERDMDQLKDPTDLNEFILRFLKKNSVVK